MTIKQIMLGLSALALSASLTPAAYAATDTGTLTVKARIGAACTLKTQNATLDFGNLTTLTDKDHFAEADITVQCSKDQAYTIGLSGGLRPFPGNDTGRNMISEQRNVIPYNLYQDAKHEKRWNSGFRGEFLKHATGDGADQKHTIYGEIIKAKATPPAGDYTDTVAIEVTY